MLITSTATSYGNAAQAFEAARGMVAARGSRRLPRLGAPPTLRARARELRDSFLRRTHCDFRTLAARATRRSHSLDNQRYGKLIVNTVCFACPLNEQARCLSAALLGQIRAAWCKRPRGKRTSFSRC